MTERIYTDSKDSNIQRLYEYKKDYLLGKIKNGINVEVRHSLLDSVIASEELEKQVKKETQKEVRYWDISKVKITDLFNPASVLKAFRKTKILNNIRKEYSNQKKGNEKTLTNVVKTVLLVFVTLLYAITALISYVTDFLEIETMVISVGAADVPLRAAMLLIAFVILFLMWCGFICKKRNEKRKYFIDKINELQGDLPEDDIDIIIKSLKPKKCSLNKHCINLIVNAYNLPVIILKILHEFISYQTNRQGYLRPKNTANIVFSLNDTESPFFNSDGIEINLTRLRLERLSYAEKMEYLDEEHNKNPIDCYPTLKVLLKHLGIDIIKYAAKNTDIIKQISEDLMVCKEFKNQLDSMVEDSRDIIIEEDTKRKDIIIILLYFYTYLSNLNGEPFTESELVDLLNGKDEDKEREKLCSEIKEKLKIPSELEAGKLLNRIFKNFSKIFENKRDYKFRDYLGAILYLCADNVIDDHITDITKLCILKTAKLKSFSTTETEEFVTKVCVFLKDKPDVANYDIFLLLLERTENHKFIYLHYFIFDIINIHIKTDEALRQKVANSPAIIRSAFLSLVHSRYEETLAQHVKFIRHCASTIKIQEQDISEYPVYMDIFNLDPIIRNQYYADLLLFDKKTLQFIEFLYKLYCVSFENSDIISDSHFFINKSLVDIDKKTLINDIKKFCNFNLFANSIFNEFIDDIEKLMFTNDYELSDYSRELYTFLIQLYYYANNSILEENFVKFVDLIINSDNLGITTKCELMSVFGFFHSYQRRRISEFLVFNANKLVEIMKTRIQEDKFTIELAYKSIPNIVSIHHKIVNNNELIDLRDNFVRLIEERFPFEFKRFNEDAIVLLYLKINDSIDIKDLAHRMSSIHPDLVSLVLSNIVGNKDIFLTIIRENFEILKESTLLTTLEFMLFYCNEVEANHSDIDVLQYLIDRISGNNSKTFLSGLLKVLYKWRSLLGDKYVQASIATIERIYELLEIQVKTNAIEKNNDESLEENLKILMIERDNEIQAFLESTDMEQA